MSIKGAAIAATIVLTALPVEAATITTLYNTGVDNAGVATTGNGADLHWALTSGTIGAGVVYTGGVNGTFPIPPWVADDATSRWVTPTPIAGDGLPSGIYDYTTTFSLTGFKASTASFSGQFAADDYVDEILLNGVNILPTLTEGGFSFYTPFDSTGGTFLAGTNTLTFEVGNGGGPTGLRIDVTGTADAVPEPAVWGLMVAGFGLVGFAARRRTHVVAA